MKRRDLEGSSTSCDDKEKEDSSSIDGSIIIRRNSISSQASQDTSSAAGGSRVAEASLTSVNIEHQSCQKWQNVNDLHTDTEATKPGTVCRHDVSNQDSLQTTEITKMSTVFTSNSDIDSSAFPNTMLDSRQNAQMDINTLTNTEILEPFVPYICAGNIDGSSCNIRLAQCPYDLGKSGNEETERSPGEVILSPSQTNSAISVIRKSNVNSRNVSVINIKRETGVIENKREMPEYMPSAVHSLTSSKSREVNSQQDEMYPSSTGDKLPMSGNVGEIITTDIPQSLSTDSGIGSPLESRTGIDPGVSQDMELGQDGKWKVENSLVSSLVTRVLPPNAKDRSENCSPCVYQGDNPLLSSSSDTSNYPSFSATTASQSFHACAFSKHDTSSHNPQPTRLKEHLELECRTFLSEKDVSLKKFTTTLATFPQKATKFHDKSFTSKGNHSTSTYIENVDKASQKGESNSGITRNSGRTFNDERQTTPGEAPLIPDNDKESLVIHKIQTTEFTVEHETCNSAAINNGKRIAALFCENKQNEVTRPGLTLDDISTSAHRQISGNVNNTIHVTEDIPNDAPEIAKKVHNACIPSDLPTSGRKVKGILKTTSAPSLGEKRERTVTLAEILNGETRDEAASSRSVSFNKIHTKNTFSYNNTAFEGEIITEPSKRPSLAEVVSHLMRQNSIVEIDEDNSHPYGRDSSLNDLMTGKRRDNYNIDAGKMIVWLALAIMLVSLAGGIIFMSETYNLNHKNQEIMMPTEDTTLPDIGR